ncbi:MAG TPA: outer membrane lipoprotein-sorting protein [Rectinemataceae bacterium]|nr:outer membrane lipoprotein-sorting protein [Rectinemataceae bacterium]
MALSRIASASFRTSWLALVAGILFLSPAAVRAAGDTDYTQLLRKADALVTFPDTDFSAEYTFVQEKPGQGKSTKQAMVFRRDKENTYLIVMVMPVEDKGKGYLKSDDNLWFYDPVSRRFTFTSAKERFQNMNARNSDFTRSNLAGDYKVTGAHRESLGKYECWVLDLLATSDEIPSPKMRIWISDDGLARKTEDYSLSGQKLRTTAFPQYQVVGNRYVPQTVVILDELRGAMINGVFVKERTTYTITRPSMQSLPDATFSKAWLEKLSD